MEDIGKLQKIMSDVSKLEGKLNSVKSDKVTSETIELKASIKKLLTSPPMSEVGIIDFFPWLFD